MAETTKKKKAKPPSVKQLRARAKFVKMVKARAKAARAAKKAAGIKPKKRATVKKTIKRTAPARKVAAKKSVKRAAPKRRNTTPRTPGQWEKLWSNYVRAREAYEASLGKSKSSHKAPRMRLAKAEKAIEKFDPGFLRRISKNPGTAKGKALFKEFAGRPARKVSEAYAPKGSGAKGTLGAMGKLVKIKVRGRTALDFTPTKAILARDAKNQMYVLGKGYKLTLKGKRHNPTGFEDLGQIDEISYLQRKDHLGDEEIKCYFHHMGEEGGAKPHLLVNDEGLAIISGGDYTITERGIEN